MCAMETVKLPLELTGHKEIRSRLPVVRLVSHVDEILPRAICGPEVRHAALVDHADLVEVLIQLLSCLIDRDYRRLPTDVGGDTQCLDKFQSG